MPSDNACPRVVLVGLPNAGKSTLFNRLVGQRAAIVLDQPGVTRDCYSVRATIPGTDRLVEFIDTPGALPPRASGLLDKAVSAHMRQAIQSADAVVFLIDAKEKNLSPQLDFFREVRQCNKPLILALNKCDNGAAPAHSDWFATGMEALPIAAANGRGISALGEAIIQTLTQAKTPPPHMPAGDSEDEPIEKQGIRLAIIGRPNVGKSTLLNGLIQRNAQLVADTPGVTRDAVDFSWEHNGVPFTLVDTAGIRRRTHIEEYIEKISVERALGALEGADVCVLVVDAVDLAKGDYGDLLKQDLTLLARITDAGRCPIIALNKWDLVPNQTAFMRQTRRIVDEQLRTVQGLEILPMCARNSVGIRPLLDTAIALSEKWRRRLPTGKLNQWLKEETDQSPPPIRGSRRARLKYITQVSTCPPEFVVFCTKAGDIGQTYKRFLINRLRKAFDIYGVPLTLHFKQQTNPYQEKRQTPAKR